MACFDMQLKQMARGGMGGASVMDETTGQGNMGQGFGQGFDNRGSGVGKRRQMPHCLIRASLVHCALVQASASLFACFHNLSWRQSTCKST